MTSTKLSIFLMATIAYSLGALMAFVMLTNSSTTAQLSISTESTTSSLALVIYLVIAIVAMAILYKAFKNKYLFAFKNFMPLIIYFYILFSSFLLALSFLVYLGLAFEWAFYLAGLIGLIVTYIAYRTDRYNNELAIIISAVFIAVIGTELTPFWAIIILIAFSVWDLIAVFKLKFMQGIAMAAVEGKKGKMFPLFIYSGDKAILQSKLDPNLPKPKNVKVSLLGLGDIAIPGAFAVSVLVANGLWLFLPVILAILAGLGLDLYIAGLYKKAIPALPIIMLCCLATWLII